MVFELGVGEVIIGEFGCIVLELVDKLIGSRGVEWVRLLSLQKPAFELRELLLAHVLLFYKIDIMQFIRKALIWTS